MAFLARTAPGDLVFIAALQSVFCLFVLRMLDFSLFLYLTLGCKVKMSEISEKSKTITKFKSEP